MPFYLGEHPGSHPFFPAGSSAAIESLAAPRELRDIVPYRYSAADDEAIRAWVRRTVGTAYHSISTCQMRRREAGGVVDERLNVYGVKGLKVAGACDERANDVC
jgi:alcohol oxidase